VLVQGQQGLAVPGYQFARDAGRVLGLQDRHLGDDHRREPSVLLHLRRPAGREDQVADASPLSSMAIIMAAPNFTDELPSAAPNSDVSRSWRTEIRVR